MRYLVVIFSILSLSLPCVMAQDTERYYLSGADADDAVLWDFYCTEGRNSGKWSKIKVPSCWELEGYGGYNYGHDTNKHAEHGLYRTRFKLPPEWKKMRVFIVFEGSMTDTKISVNGTQAGAVHQGSFYRFKREITTLVKFDIDNLLEVDVAKMSSNASVNKAEREADFWVFGGIYRPVYLEAVPRSFIEYAAIDAGCNGDLNMEVHTNQLLSDVSIKTTLEDLTTSQVVAQFTNRFSESSDCFRLKNHVSNVISWTAETPYLYQATIELQRKGKTVHRITEKIGFRTVEVKPRDGIYINGKKIIFKGVNRHCFWPSTGRTVSKKQDLLDVRLIKEMNMNAVRMSHYPPDKHFLQLCDSIGLYVIDELCAWQYPPYDTPVGRILATEMIVRDVNHPSIIFWANGNEGGFNDDLDPLFPQLDLQKRPVLHPWEFFSGINTIHYINYNSSIKSMYNGREIFMPTEQMHGLYDGGHGAGLDDYWNLMLQNPLSAGMFLWDFADQGVVRTDRNGELDTDKDHGADGIVGPYREKEGSFYTVKEIWSPIYIDKKYITLQWDGTLDMENRYQFTNTRHCNFTSRLTKVNDLKGSHADMNCKVIAPDLEPGERGKLKLELPDNWRDYDFLYVTAQDRNGMELFTWSFELQTPADVSERLLGQSLDTYISNVQSMDSCYLMVANGVKAVISSKSGLLKQIVVNGRNIPLSNGPVFITDQTLSVAEVNVVKEDCGTCIHVRYNYTNGRRAYSFAWRMSSQGILRLDYDYVPRDRVEMAGITFSFPEMGIVGADLLAKGPYRVYNNRMKGGSFGLWNKAYNDAVTGEEWIYPEFKGYYANFYAMKLNCATPLEVYNSSEDISLHLFTPRAQTKYPLERNYTHPVYPKGNISFMDAIPAVGTKFGVAENYGPQSQLHRYNGFGRTTRLTNTIFFKFQ